MAKYYYLGIDIGSVSTNLVLVDDNGMLVRKLYLRTGGEPIKVLCQGLDEMGRQFASYGDDAVVGACGATGSGRKIAAVIAGADIVKNEITAQATAAMKTVPGVRTVIEIGGQDSKIIFTEKGCVVDFAMNTVCAAGTGSFLDRQAARLGIPIDEFGERALRAISPVRIAGRCAVFAESDMIHKQQTGHSIEDIISGLCEALARNYLSNLARGREIAEPIAFQGGVAANRGIVAAFEKLIAKKLIVPAHYDVMGAYGAALLAMEATEDRDALRDEEDFKSVFKGFQVSQRKYEVRSSECTNCPNNCEIVDIIDSNGNTLAHWGSRCGRQ